MKIVALMGTLLIARALWADDHGIAPPMGNAAPAKAGLAQKQQVYKWSGRVAPGLTVNLELEYASPNCEERNVLNTGVPQTKKITIPLKGWPWMGDRYEIEAKSFLPQQLDLLRKCDFYLQKAYFRVRPKDASLKGADWTSPPISYEHAPRDWESLRSLKGIKLSAAAAPTFLTTGGASRQNLVAIRLPDENGDQLIKLDFDYSK